MCCHSNIYLLYVVICSSVLVCCSVSVKNNCLALISLIIRLFVVQTKYRDIVSSHKCLSEWNRKSVGYSPHFLLFAIFVVF